MKATDIREEAENLKVIRKFLMEKGVISTGEKTLSSRGRLGEGRPITIGIQSIYDWLNKKGEVLSIGIISEHLKVIRKWLREKGRSTVEQPRQGKRTDLPYLRCGIGWRVI